MKQMTEDAMKPTGPAGTQIPRNQARRMLNPLYLGGPVIVALTAIFAPLDVLERFPLLADLCRQMVEWFPFLGEHERRSSYPQVMTLVKCLSFALLPVAVVGGWVVFWGGRYIVLARRRAGLVPRHPWWMELLGCGLFILGLIGNWVLTNEPTFCQGCTTRNRFGLAFMDAGALWGLGSIPGFIALVMFLRSKKR